MYKKDLIYYSSFIMLVLIFTIFSKFKENLVDSKKFKIKNFNSILEKIDAKKLNEIWDKNSKKKNEKLDENNGWIQMQLILNNDSILKAYSFFIQDKNIKGYLQINDSKYFNNIKYLIGINEIYLDNKNWKIILESKNLLENNLKTVGINQNFNKEIISMNKEKKMENYMITLDFSKNKELINLEIENIEFSLLIKSKDWNIKSNIIYPNIKRRKNIYQFSIFNFFICIFNLLNVFLIIDQIFNNNYGKFYSISFFCCLSVYEVIECFSNLFYSFQFDDNYNLFFLSSLINITVFSLFIIKLFNKIGKDQVEYLIASRGYEISQLKKFIFIFYLKIYLILIVGICFGLKIFPNYWFYIIYNNLFILQIIKIWTKNTIFFPKFTYLISIFISKQFYNFYYNYYDNNFLNNKTNSYYYFISIIILFLQYIIYFTQTKIGSNIFYSIKNLKESEKYLVKKKYLSKELLKLECSICYEEFSKHNKDIIKGFDNDNNLKKISENKSKYLIKTKCNHYFHVPCLILHMNYKDNCPICRTKINNIML